LTRFLVIVTVIWFSITLFAPLEPGTYIGVMSTHGLQFIIPAVLALVGVYHEFYPKLMVWKVFNVKLLTIIGLVVLGVTGASWAVNYITGIPVPTYGSYNTVGVLLLLFLLSLNVLKDRLSPPRACILSLLSVFASVGFWECLYQVCSWATWYHTWFPLEMMAYNELLVWRPHILMFVPFVVVLVYYARSAGYRFQWWTLVFSATFAVMWVVWYVVGDYWILWYCDHYQYPPVWVYNTPINWVWYLLARGSKGILALAQVFLVAGIIESQFRPDRKWLYVVGVCGISMSIWLFVVLRT